MFLTRSHTTTVSDPRRTTSTTILKSSCVCVDSVNNFGYIPGTTGPGKSTLSTRYYFSVPGTEENIFQTLVRT